MAHPAASTQHHCKDCNIFFDSSKSLDVHLQYHQEQPIGKWGQPGAASHASHGHGEDNNNFIKPAATTAQSTKRGDFGAVTAPADSSDMQAFQQQQPGQNFQPFSPQFNFNNRTARSPTPNGMTNQGFGPSGPQQPQQEFNNMRPPSTGSVKQEPGTFGFGGQEPQPGEQNGQSGSGYILGPNDDFPVMPGGRPPSTPNSAPPPSPQSTQMQIPTSTPSYRFHPYGGHPGMSQQYNPGGDRNVVSSSSPVPRPSPAPSPQHCEKCGVMCPSQESLREHQAMAHGPHGPPHMPQGPPPGPPHGPPHGFQQFQPFRPKTEQDEESSILDLDSQKINSAYQEEERRRQQQQMGGQHSVSALLNWVDTNSPAGPPPGPPGHPGHPPPGHPGQQMWQRNGMQPNGPLGGMSTGPMGPGPGPGPGPGGPPFNPAHHGMQGPPHPQPQYQHRPYLNSVADSSAVSGVNGSPGLQLITSSANPMSPGGPGPQGNAPLEPGNTNAGKGGGKVGGNAAWKSNEARRPKTYHCSACNKWFTSSGHLKRHYNTTLHKNAVKQSGAPDPATMPVSTHHHPERDPKNSNGVKNRATPVNLDSSASPAPSSGGGEESSPSDDASHSNGFGRTTPVQGLPPAPQQQPPPQQSMQHMPPPHQPHQLTASPPNRLAGPSEMTTGGLLSMSPYHHDPALGPLPGQPSPTQHPFLGVGLHPSLPPPPLSAPHPIHQPAPMHHFQHIPPTSMGHNPGGHHPPPSTMGGLHSTMTAYPNGLPPHDSTPTTLSTSHHHHHHLTSTTGSLPLPLEPTATGKLLPPMSTLVQYPAHPAYGGYVVSASQNVGGLSPVPMDSTMMLPPSHEGEPGGPSEGVSAPHLTTLESVAQPSAPLSGPGGEMRLKITNSFSMAALRVDEDMKPTIDVKSEPPRSPPDYPTSTDDIMREKELQKRKMEESANRKRRKRPRYDDTNVNVISSSTEGKSPPAEKVTNMSGGLVFKSSMISEGGFHKCLDCDKVFNKACYLTQHNKSFHAGDKPFKCDRCGKRFQTEDLYKEHLGKHAGDKPYKCQICPKQFNHKTDLRRHLCLHSGEKPFACDVCGKGFIRKDHMLKHVETHSRSRNNHFVHLNHHQISA